ncbi:uncharacterized protein LOC116844957 isoform X2 [Odontomachus brunneus]|uniref:uncharacterized protein LOC116844957 isoform X2 n=1 Tax=Odontomachus brunneus TaxID=486640 RepID=UPI0013F1FAE2|nr:uncharacterized protein LOC116844957 isoform X2 [Odontomachus brunneus]
MSDDLLAKEKEFHKLNQELQLKKYDVMKKMSFFTHANTTNESFNNIKQYINPTMKDVRTTYLRDKTSSTDKQLRKSSPEVSEVLSIENIADTEISLKKYNNLGNEAIIKLLKGKIDMLYKELQTIQHEYNNECGYSKELEVKNKKLNETQVKLHSQIGSLSDTITKLQDINHDILSKYQGLSNENIVLKKGLRNQIKKLQEDKNLAIQNLEKQQMELVQAFRKQILLIDNLKQQNIYLIASGKIHLTGADFTKLLEWKP